MLKDAEKSSDGQVEVEAVSADPRSDEDNYGDDTKALMGLVSELLNELRERTERDTAKDLLVSRVVERLDALERDFLFREFRQPVFRDLVLLTDRVTSLSAQFGDSKAVAAAFESIERELLEILRRQGVTPIEATCEAFNAESQEVVAVECTDDPAMDSAVLAVKRRGFSYRGTILRPQGVVVARLQKEVAEDE